MRAVLIVSAVAMMAVAPVRAQNLGEIEKFIQKMCGDIPSGSLTRSSIKGKLHANAGALADILKSAGLAQTTKTEEIYSGIPFEKLPPNIPTMDMCKTEVLKLLVPLLPPVNVKIFTLFSNRSGTHTYEYFGYNRNYVSEAHIVESRWYIAPQLWRCTANITKSTFATSVGFSINPSVEIDGNSGLEFGNYSVLADVSDIVDIERRLSAYLGSIDAKIGTPTVCGVTGFVYVMLDVEYFGATGERHRQSFSIRLDSPEGRTVLKEVGNAEARVLNSPAGTTDISESQLFKSIKERLLPNHLCLINPSDPCQTPIVDCDPLGCRLRRKS
jgi:hypothetical protein